MSTICGYEKVRRPTFVQESAVRSADPDVMVLRFFRGAVVSSILAVSIAGCATHQPALPSNVTTGAPTSMPSPPDQTAAMAPQIVAMHFSSLRVLRGEEWTGAIVTGTNIASVEVRTNLFSIDVPRSTFGHFAFALDLLDVPPIFLRKYTLRVIARTASGIEREEDLPFEIAPERV